MKTMRKIAVVGGKLQGTEACYLAKAGWHVIPIDRNKDVPAQDYVMSLFTGMPPKRQCTPY